MKPLIKGNHLESSISSQFDKRLIWYRRFWNSYYAFEHDMTNHRLTVFKNMYNQTSWQDEWMEVHRFELSGE